MKTFPRFVLVLAALCLLAAVHRSVGAQEMQAPPRLAVTYHVEPLAAGELPKRFSASQLGVLEKLNRRDLTHLARLTEIVVPDAWLPTRPDAWLPTRPDAWLSTQPDTGPPGGMEDELAYSPLPSDWPWAVSMPKALIVHQPAQVFGAYEYGRLVRWGPVSTGRRENPTPSGTFNLTWKSKSRRSTDNDAWLMKWYFNFINSRGVSFHEFDLPGSAASHACVRLLTRDAMWVYEWGEQWVLSEDRRTVTTPGTAVVVQGVVDFKNPTPWTVPSWWQTPLTLFGG